MILRAQWTKWIYKQVSQQKQAISLHDNLWGGDKHLM